MTRLLKLGQNFQQSESKAFFVTEVVSWKQLFPKQLSGLFKKLENWMIVQLNIWQLLIFANIRHYETSWIVVFANIQQVKQILLVFLTIENDTVRTLIHINLIEWCMFSFQTLI